MWDLHSPIPSQAVPSQHLHPTHLQHSHGLSSASWSLIQAVVYQPPPDMSACCVWGTGSQSRREGSVLQDTFAKSTYLGSLSISQGLMCTGRLPSRDTTHGLHQLCTLSVHLHISHSDVGSQEVHFHLWASIFPSTTSADTKNHLAQVISHGLHGTKKLQLSRGLQDFLCLHDHRFIFPPSRTLLHKTASVTTEVHH